MSIADDLYQSGVQEGIKRERARVEENHRLLLQHLTTQQPYSPAIDSIIDLAIKQVITGEELGRTSRDRSQ